MCNIYTVKGSLFVAINCIPKRRLRMTFREIDKILKANGWKLIRVTGSHYQYRKVGYESSVVVPNHRGKTLSIGVIKDVEKKTGLSLGR